MAGMKQGYFRFLLALNLQHIMLHAHFARAEEKFKRLMLKIRNAAGGGVKFNSTKKTCILITTQ